jgi:hypothetical protein
MSATRAASGKMSKRWKSYKSYVSALPDGEVVTCTDLLVVDQAPFLKKALSTCKRLRKELDKKQALLAVFEEEDRIAYERWLNRTYGALLTQVRELREELSAYQFILHHLSQCVYRAIEEVPELYRELFRLKKKSALYSYVPPQVEQPESAGEDWEDGPFGSDEGEDEIDEDMRAYFDEMFGEGRSERNEESHESRVDTAPKVSNDARLKSCYRQLAKRLHPDHSKLDGPVREKRWHEIQAAYHNHDLEALLRVEAICDMDAEGLSVKLGLARLRDLAAYHKSHLIPIRHALRAAKQRIAFGFAEQGPCPKIEREVAGDLKYEQIDLKAAVAELAQTAKGIRNEVEAHIRESEIRANRAARYDDRELTGRSKSKPIPQKQAAPRKSEASGPEQMTFF